MSLPPSYKAAIERKMAVLQETARVKSKTIQARGHCSAKIATAKGNYEAALYKAKGKAILSQPEMITLMNAETFRIYAEKGKSPYGENNVFGVVPSLFTQKSNLTIRYKIKTL